LFPCFGSDFQGLLSRRQSGRLLATIIVVHSKAPTQSNFPHDWHRIRRFTKWEKTKSTDG
jgi:hypothetical protein